MHLYFHLYQISNLLGKSGRSPDGGIGRYAECSGKELGGCTEARTGIRFMNIVICVGVLYEVKIRKQN